MLLLSSTAVAYSYGNGVKPMITIRSPTGYMIYVLQLRAKPCPKSTEAFNMRWGVQYTRSRTVSLFTTAASFYLLRLIGPVGK
jgi:hypothetical protein